MARLPDLIGLMPSMRDGPDETFTKQLLRECARCQVVVRFEEVFERIDVPLVGSHRVSVRPGRSYVRLEIVQGPAGGIGQRPLPAAVMQSADARTWMRPGPCNWLGAKRASFGGIELEMTMPNEATLWTVMKRLYWALVRDGDLRNFDLPNPRDIEHLMREAGASLPWRGYDLRAA